MIALANNPLSDLIEVIRKVCDIDLILEFKGESHHCIDSETGLHKQGVSGNYVLAINPELSINCMLEVIIRSVADIIAESRATPESRQYKEEWCFWYDNIHSEFDTVW